MYKKFIYYKHGATNHNYDSYIIFWGELKFKTEGEFITITIPYVS